MRQTLGLGSRGRPQMRVQTAAAGPKQRHRFVQDGEVQVIHLSGTRDGDAVAPSRARIAALEAALEAEQAAHAKAEQSAQAATAQVHALETKLAHVEMATREAIAAEREARALVEAELRQALAARDAAQQAPAPQTPAVRQTKMRTKPASPRGQVKQPRVKEPKPVKWWLGKTAGR